MATDKLGFTFYPKDWWTSEAFEDLTPTQRYIYLEYMFLMYSNGGFLDMTIEELEDRMKKPLKNPTKNPIKTEDWEAIKPKLIETEHGITFKSILKRLRKTLANRENGSKGGRPKKGDSVNPTETQAETHENPPLEKNRIEREREENVKAEKTSESFDAISEEEFVEIWKAAMLHYDKKKSGIDRLTTFEKQNFRNLAKIFPKKKFQQAVAGLFFQPTVQAVRIRPDHLLKEDYFEKYIHCWVNQSPMYGNPKTAAQEEKPKFQKGDI